MERKVKKLPLAISNLAKIILVVASFISLGGMSTYFKICPADTPYKAGEECLVGPFDFIIFDKGSAVITTKHEEALNRQAEWLKEWPGAQAIIKGYSDEDELAADNLDLAERRALATKLYLVAVGIDKKRIEIMACIRPQKEGSCGAPDRVPNSSAYSTTKQPG